ncbi:D-alanyl-D-alanine dipeptidase [Salmonella enterica subsp. enterica serovar Typhimurium]|nr:D-alanyl-D-alanine dipeptidase [Salmonella enterica subsp. enterica serovar Typhimurium]
MKKSDGEIHEKTASWGILQSEWLKKMWTAIIAVTLPLRYRMGFFSVTRHDCGRDIFVRRIIISSHNICTDYRNH